MGTDQIHITWIYKKMSRRAICHIIREWLYFESRLCRSSIPPRMFNVSDSDLFLGVQWGVTIKPPSSPVGIVEEEERKMEKRSRHLGLKGRWGWGGPDKNIRSMAQQGLCHPKFSKCVQNKHSYMASPISLSKPGLNNFNDHSNKIPGEPLPEVSPIKCDVRECVVRTSDSLENLTF